MQPHNADLTKGYFSHVLWTSHNKFYANIETIFYLYLYMFTYRSICLPRINIEKSNDLEKHLKKYG